jgi:tetratricopeptide (TPR) repeat protein
MSSLAALHARLSELDARLDARLDGATDATGPLTPDARAALKSEIIALIREAGREAAALLALKEEAKSLAAKWKRLPVAAAVPEPDVPEPAASESAAPAVLSTRVDHLGASTFVSKGWTAICAGDFVAAEQALARALELAPEDLEAATLHGWSLMGQQRLDEALAVLQGVLARQPSHELARVNVGYVCLQKGIYGEAIEHLVRAARGGVDRKAALYANYYLGLVYLRREMYDDAVSFFQHALTHGPNLVEARYELGRALWFAGDRAGALEAWRAGASAGKFNAWAKRCGEVYVTVEQGGTPPAVAA